MTEELLTDAEEDLWNPARQARSTRRDVALMPSVCECGRPLAVVPVDVTGDGIEPYRFLYAYCPPCNLLWHEGETGARS